MWEASVLRRREERERRDRGRNTREKVIRGNT